MAKVSTKQRAIQYHGTRAGDRSEAVRVLELGRPKGSRIPDFRATGASDIASWLSFAGRVGSVVCEEAGAQGVRGGLA